MRTVECLVQSSTVELAPAAVAALQYSPVHHRLRVSAKKNLEISEIADAGKKSEIEISAALVVGHLKRDY